MGEGVGLWTLGKVCALVSAVKCVNLAIHRPVLLGLIIHYMLIKKIIKKRNRVLIVLTAVDGQCIHFLVYEKEIFLSASSALTTVLGVSEI